MAWDKQELIQLNYLYKPYKCVVTMITKGVITSIL